MSTLRQLELQGKILPAATQPPSQQLSRAQTIVFCCNNKVELELHWKRKVCATLTESNSNKICCNNWRCKTK
jgi:hypothetical protein